jgi:zinc transporter, ZIP family
MLLESTIIGIIIGSSGTLLGGVLAMFIGKKATEPRPFLAFAGGIMVAVVFFDLFIESASMSGMTIMAGGAVLGGAVFALISPLFHDESDKSSLYSMGILVLIGIAFHNLPEGLAIGSTLAESEKFAISLGILIFVHDIPEGIAVCLPLRLSGMSVKKVLWLAFLTGMPTALGCVVGTTVGMISREMIALCISFAGGAMLYISLKELIPAGGGKRSILYSLIGLCTGFIMATLINAR